MSSQTKHETNKFRWLKTELCEDNWISWKRGISAVLKDRQLLGIVLGTEPRPISNNISRPVTRSGSGSPQEEENSEDAIAKWDERNDVAYNQILLNISPQLQSTLDNTENAHEAWKALLDFFESDNASVADTIHAKYETCFYVEGTSMMVYISRLRELRNQLGLLGQPVTDKAHASRMLRNLPKTLEWQLFAETIRNSMTSDPVKIAQRLQSKHAQLELDEPRLDNTVNSAIKALKIAQLSKSSTQRANSMIIPSDTPSNARATTSAKKNKSKKLCTHCNRTSHNVEDCWNKNKEKCSYCNRLNHTEENCHKKGFDLFQASKESKANSANLQTSNIVSLMAVSTVDYTTTTTEALRATSGGVLPKLHFWCLDSGATAHLCND